MRAQESNRRPFCAQRLSHTGQGQSCILDSHNEPSKGALVIKRVCRDPPQTAIFPHRPRRRGSARGNDGRPANRCAWWRSNTRCFSRTVPSESIFSRSPLASSRHVPGPPGPRLRVSAQPHPQGAGREPGLGEGLPGPGEQALQAPKPTCLSPTYAVGCAVESSPASRVPPGQAGQCLAAEMLVDAEVRAPSPGLQQPPPSPRGITPSGYLQSPRFHLLPVFSFESTPLCFSHYMDYVIHTQGLIFPPLSASCSLNLEESRLSLR